MKHKVPIRIIVEGRLPNVLMMIQNGRNDLLRPSDSDRGRLVFEFELHADLNSEMPNFLGPFSQGPRGSRFIYLNSGTYAGQEGTKWARRAKLSLSSVTAEMVREVLDTRGARLETVVKGVGPDGGPICASVKGVEWKVAR